MRSAAHFALTRGRWHPVAFVATKGLEAARKQLSDSTSLQFRAAWALAPGEAFRACSLWKLPGEDAFHEEYRRQKRFLWCVAHRLVQVLKVIIAFELTYSVLHSMRDRPIEELDRGDMPRRPLYIFDEWLRRMNAWPYYPVSDHRCGFMTLDHSTRRGSRMIAQGLERWADPKLAAHFANQLLCCALMDDIDGNGEDPRRYVMDFASFWARDWADRDKTGLFVAEAGRIQDEHRKYYEENLS